MRCPRCGTLTTPSVGRCPQCRAPLTASSTPAAGLLHRGWAAVRPWIEPEDVPVNPMVYWGRVAAWVVLLLWTPSFVFAELKGDGTAMNLWMHRVYLVFHEAGHLIFGWGGRFLTVAGGTLMQLLMPLAVVAAFLRQGHVFGAAVGLWWLGGSFVDCAPYIYDARLGDLPLLGGGTGADRPETHDWMNMLRWTGLIMWDTRIAWATHLLGSALMVLALGWGGWALRVQRGRVDDLA